MGKRGVSDKVKKGIRSIVGGYAFIMKIFFVLMFLIIGCGKEKNPVESTKKGKLVVGSEPAGAVVLIDGANTGKVTPDSFEVSEGRHKVEVYLIGYKKDSVDVFVGGGERKEIFFTLEPESLRGFLYVESFPPSAEIIVDYQSTGSFSPDTLTLPVGRHIVELALANFRMDAPLYVDIQEDSVVVLNVELRPVKSVLVEYFSNVSCQGCGIAARFVHNLDLYYASRMNVISYHARFPNPLDPFYTYNPSANQQRIGFYSVVSLPDIIVDGERVDDPTDSVLFANIVARRINVDAPVGFVGEAHLDNGNIIVSVKCYGYANITGVLRAAVVEDYIHFDSPPGSNGETDFFSVMRKFTEVGPIQLVRDSVVEREFVFPFEHSTMDGFSVVLFLQGDNNTVYQTLLIR